jgi:hypothetical protein
MLEATHVLKELPDIEEIPEQESLHENKEEISQLKETIHELEILNKVIKEENEKLKTQGALIREKYHKLKKKYKDRKKDAKLRNATYQETIQENENYLINSSNTKTGKRHLTTTATKSRKK